MTQQSAKQAATVKWAGWALFALLVALSMRLILSAIRRHVLDTADSPMIYHAGTLYFNYWDFGFIRRGLGGSLARLLDDRPMRATAYFHALSALWVSAALCLLWVRLRAAPLQRALYAVLLVALMMRWAEDAGRTDMLVTGLLAFAALAVQRGRVRLACAWVVAGLAVHETGFIYGLPLLAALALDPERRRVLTRSQRLGAAALLGGALVVYALKDFLPHASTQTMVDTVHARLPEHEFVDWAIYFGVSGSRGVATSICQNLGDPNYALHAVTGVLVIGLFLFVLSPPRKVALAAGLAAVVPFLFMVAVANDMSRWAMFAACNVWLVCAVRSETSANAQADARRWPDRALWARGACALLLIPLIHPKIYRIDDPIFAPTPILEGWALRLGGPKTPRFAQALPRCDPQWRSVLGAGQSPRP